MYVCMHVHVFIYMYLHMHRYAYRCFWGFLVWHPVIVEAPVAYVNVLLTSGALLSLVQASAQRAVLAMTLQRTFSR